MNLNAWQLSTTLNDCIPKDCDLHSECLICHEHRVLLRIHVIRFPPIKSDWRCVECPVALLCMAGTLNRIRMHRVSFWDCPKCGTSMRVYR